MNFGKNNLQKKREYMRRSRRPFYTRITVITVMLILIGAVAAILFFSIYTGRRISHILKETPGVEAVLDPDETESKVLDTDGKEIAVFRTEDLIRSQSEPEEIPEQIGSVFISWLDPSFYDHPGSLVQNIITSWVESVFQGKKNLPASGTITERLVDNTVYMGLPGRGLFGNGELLLKRQYLASRLEEVQSKDWILTAWLNSANFGENIRGIQAGADRYFVKNVQDLTLSETAALAAIIDDPEGCDPVTHPKKNDAVRRKILENMLSEKLISEQECDAAEKDNVYERIPAVREGYPTVEENRSSFVRSMKRKLLSDLISSWNCTYSQAENILYTGGLTIQSTQNSDVDRLIRENELSVWKSENESPRLLRYRLSILSPEKEVHNYAEDDLLAWMQETDNAASLLFSDSDEAMEAAAGFRSMVLEEGGTVLGEEQYCIPQPQSAVVLTEQSTGKVRAMIGERGDDDSAYFNRAGEIEYDTGAVSQAPGTYATALDNGYLTLSGGVGEIGKTGIGGKAENEKTFREVIADQDPEETKKLDQILTAELCQETLAKFGITRTATGAKATVLDIAAAYGAIANQGVWKEPVFYTKAQDRFQKNVLRTEHRDRPVVRDTTAWLLTQAMQDSVKSGSCSLAGLDHMYSAAQRSGRNDGGFAWYAGYTPYYTCVVWSGYDDSGETADEKKSMTIWYNVMTEIHSGLEEKPFQKPEGIQSEQICTLSGQQAVSGVCPDTAVEYYTYGTQPSGACERHETALICTETGLLAGEGCPEDLVEKRTYEKDAEDRKKRMPERVCTVHNAENQSESPKSS